MNANDGGNEAVGVVRNGDDLATTQGHDAGTNGDELVGMVRDGRVELTTPVPWPEGASVRVVLVDAQPNTPEAIAAWLVEEDTRPQLSPEDLAAWQKDWAAYQAFLKAPADAHTNGVLPS